MKDVSIPQQNKSNIHESHVNSRGMRELTIDEMKWVSGGGLTEAGAATAVGAGIGAATFGGAWGAVGVGAAFAIAPIAVVAMAGCALYAGWHYAHAME